MAVLVDIIVPPGLKDPVTLIVDASRMEAEGDLDVIVRKCGEIVEDAKVKVVCKDELVNKYHIEFTPSAPDLYSVTLKYAGEEVEGASPLELNLSPPKAREVLLTQPPIGKIKAGQSIDVVFNTFPSGRGQLTASCSGDVAGNIPVLVTRKGISMEHKVTFVPPQEDEYSLTVLYSGHAVKGSPYKIDLIPVYPNLVQCSKPVIPENPCGPIEMDVCTEGAGNAKLNASCKGEGCGTVPVKVDKVSKNNYHLKFVPPKSGIFTLSVLYEGKDIMNSPITINIASKPEEVKLGDLHIPEHAGPEEEVWIDVDCSEAGNDRIKASCKGQNEEGEIPVTVEDCGSGKYRVKFTPRLPDVYGLTLFFGDHEIPNGAFDINLQPNSNSKLIHLGTFIPDDRKEPVVLSFDASNAGQGEMRARVNGMSFAGPVSSKVQLVNPARKKYQISFVPDGADTYNVDVYWSNRTRSPIWTQMICVRIMYPNEVDLTGPTEPELASPVMIAVDAKRAGPGELSVWCLGEKTGQIETEVLQDDYDKTRYNIGFRPVEADLYTFRVFFNGFEAKKSPVMVDLRQAPMFKTTPSVPVEVELEVCGPMAEESTDTSATPTKLQMTIGEPFILAVDGVEVKSQLRAVASGRTIRGVQPVNVTPKDKEGSFSVIFNPTESDVYTVNVKHKGEHVPGSPFIIDYTNLSTEDIPTHPITKPYLIRYIPQDNSLDDVVAYAMHSESSTPEALTIQSKGDGKMLLIFQAEKTGVHIIHITHNKEEIQGSPFKLDIVHADPTACKVVSVPERAYVGEEVCISIDTSRAGTADMHVTSVPGEAALAHKEISPGNSVVKFTPLVTGKHNLIVKWAGVPIPDSPILINVSELTEEIKQTRDAASQVTIKAKDIFSSQLNCEQAQFCVLTEKAGQGELTMKAKGPGKARIHVVRQKNGVYQCTVSPVVCGKYHLEILWNGIPIPGHPYKLDFTAGKHMLRSPYDDVVETSKQEHSQEHARVSGIDSPVSLSDSPHTTLALAEGTDSRPAKVTAFGPGLEGGVIGQEGNFTIKTDKAGEGRLEIAVHGARGTFRTKLRRHPDNERTILAQYDPTNIGTYTIDIMWLGKHIEGSPFVVNIKGQETE